MRLGSVEAIVRALERIVAALEEMQEITLESEQSTESPTPTTRIRE